MKRRNIVYVILSILVILSLAFTTNASASTANGAVTLDISHISDEVFSGYEGLETTVAGKVGYNYALGTPDGQHSILYGFTPYNQTAYEYEPGESCTGSLLRSGMDAKSRHWWSSNAAIRR